MVLICFIIFVEELDICFWIPVRTLKSILALGPSNMPEVRSRYYLRDCMQSCSTCSSPIKKTFKRTTTPLRGTAVNLSEGKDIFLK